MGGRRGVVLIRLPLIRLPSPFAGFVCTVRLRLTVAQEWVRGRQGQGGAEALVLATPAEDFEFRSAFGFRSAGFGLAQPGDSK